MGIQEHFKNVERSHGGNAVRRLSKEEKIAVATLLLDANSLLYPPVYAVNGDINRHLYLALGEMGRKSPGSTLNQFCTKHRLRLDLSSYNSIVNSFHRHFTEEYLNGLMVQAAVENIFNLTRDHFIPGALRILGIFYDGPPSKGKMVEQAARRAVGVVTSEYSQKLVKEKASEMSQLECTYSKSKISWSTVNLTPGTSFMQELEVAFQQIVEDPDSVFGGVHKGLKVEYSSSNEFGEGEMKVISWIEAHELKDGVCVCSPDADMTILLQLRYPQTPLSIIRHNQQESAKVGHAIYDLIDIDQYRDLFSQHVARQAGMKDPTEEEYHRINYDLAAASTVLGNDFVPRIPSINGNRNMANILTAYMSVLRRTKRGSWLIHAGEKSTLSLSFFRSLVGEMVGLEERVLASGVLASKMGIRNAQSLAWIFSEETVTQENVAGLISNLKGYYGGLTRGLKNGDISIPDLSADPDHYLQQTQRALSFQHAEVEDMSPEEYLHWLAEYQNEHGNAPGLRISTYRFQPSLTQKTHAEATRKMNAVDKELYQFRELLGPYQIVLNQSETDWNGDVLEEYYSSNCGFPATDPMTGNMTEELRQMVLDYISGVLWVVQYYYNGDTTPSRWYYPYEHAPFLTHIHQVLEEITREEWKKMARRVESYQVQNLKEYFTPAEQFIYVSPMVASTIRLLPEEYGEFFATTRGKAFLARFKPNARKYVDDIYKHRFPRPRPSQCVECKDTIYLTKCTLEGVHTLTEAEDRAFLRILRKYVHPEDESRTLPPRQFAF